MGASFEDIEAEFVDNENDVFIFIVDQSFSVKRGAQYFKKYEGSEHFINTDIKAYRHKSKILNWIFRKMPNITKQFERLFDISNERSLSVTDMIISIASVFFAEDHIAADPKALDPIIFQEGAVTKSNYSEIISLYNGCPRHPVIIIILKDDNISRVDDILSQCPDGLAFKIIRNIAKDGVIKYVINKGANNADEFLDAYVAQSFYTCSNTKRELIINNSWAQNALINKFTPDFLRIRSNLICDRKSIVLKDINEIIISLESVSLDSFTDIRVRDILLGIARLYRVFAVDYAGDDIEKVLLLAKENKSELLAALAGKYCYLLGYKIETQKDMLNNSYNVFKKNRMIDNAVYCRNNSLVLSFETNQIEVENFRELIGEAVCEVPGLVGMSHIYNNLALAELMTGNLENANNAFSHGIEYAKRQDRIVQRIGIEMNCMLAKSYYKESIAEKDILRILKQIEDGMCKRDVLPFISARYILNMLVIALRENVEMFYGIYNAHPEYEKYIKDGMVSNLIGQTQISLQLEYIKRNTSYIFDNSSLNLHTVNPIQGRRNEMICKEGLNPFYFCVWL